jgi:hypothetical protein
MMNRLTWATVVPLLLIGWGVTVWHPSLREGGRARGGDEKAEGEAKPTGKGRAPYVHTVVFYLKEDAPKDEVEQIIADAHGLLAKIPSVKGLWIGRPAEKATPKLAVTDYHVAWTLLFDDYAGLQQYLDHKLHVKFRDKHAKHAERVLIYDFINQKQ